MNHDTFEKKLIDTFCKSVERGFHGSSFISEMYLEFTKDSREYTDSLRQNNDVLIQTFKDIAQMYGIEYKEEYTSESLTKKTIELKNRIASLSVSDKPKQRYLCYAWGDDYGHSYCTVITEKDIECVMGQLNNDLESYEYLYQEDSILIKAMSVRTGKPVEYLMDLEEDDLIDEIKIFFKGVIDDKTVPLQEFSEYFECLISKSRHSSSATSWVLL